MLGDHWCWGKGGWYDASNHVPLIVRDPFAGEGKGRRIGAFTESVDIAPTILAWLGLPVPDEWNGLSLRAFLDGGTPPRWRRGVFWEFDFRLPVSEAAEAAFGIGSDECTLDVYRDDAFKYVHFTSLPPLLYDLRADPDELVNLAGRPESASILATYARKLLSHRMLHAERTLANTILTRDGAMSRHRPRGMPPDLYAPL